MAKYTVSLLPKAYRDIDEIYLYIATNILAPEAANNIIDEFEQAIFSLEEMPFRGAQRRIGAYANKGYRQLFVGNFTIIYRIEESDKQVIVVTVQYSARNF